jgi:hypothetical protein
MSWKICQPWKRCWSEIIRTEKLIKFDGAAADAVISLLISGVTDFNPKSGGQIMWPTPNKIKQESENFNPVENAFSQYNYSMDTLGTDKYCP